MNHSVLSVLLAVVSVSLPAATVTAAERGSKLPPIEINDNLRPAGQLDRGQLTLALRAGLGQWKPEGASGPTLDAEAFGEVGGSLTIPAPLVRVAEGTVIAVSIRNDLETPLAVHGLCAREGTPCPTLEVPPAETREARFTAARPGTYHYWASSMGAPVPFRELAGGFIVDPPGGATEPDRVIVITEYNSLSLPQLTSILAADDPGEQFLKLQPRYAFMMNGRSWPATERFTYRRGERVRWRVINLSSQSHPMHLHGFYFDVNSIGDGMKDVPREASNRRRVVTQVLGSGGTLDMTWVPEREGNWLFHCHIMHHVSPTRRLGEPSDTRAAHGSRMDVDHASGPHANHQSDDGSAGMAGMIIGVTVLGPASTAPAVNDVVGQARKLTLTMAPRNALDGGRAGAGFTLSGDAAPPAAGRVTAPGPPLVLRRGEPIEITVVNRLAEATAVHWHGIELDSYYDGVHGWSGIGSQRAPMIEAGGTFVVRFTPQHAGTFIYHTHLHDYRQLSSGLYGAIVVTDSGETFDPATDHVFVIGRTSVDSEAPSVFDDPASVVLNGERAPRFVWKAGQRHHVRIVNITPDDIFAVSLQASDGPVTWTPSRKDGAALPAADLTAGAARQLVAVGETYEFDYEAPQGRKNVWFEVRSTGGKWQVQGQIIVR
jgi:FtsP/CotA-like multicopper oxidase with cupredoxin domain